MIIDKTKNIGALVDGFVRLKPPDARFKDVMESACVGSSYVYNRFVRNVVVIYCRLVLNWDLKGVEGGWIIVSADNKWFACVLTQ